MIHMEFVRLLVWLFTGKNEVVPPPLDGSDGASTEMQGMPVING